MKIDQILSKSVLALSVASGLSMNNINTDPNSAQIMRRADMPIASTDIPYSAGNMPVAEETDRTIPSVLGMEEIIADGDIKTREKREREHPHKEMFPYFMFGTKGQMSFELGTPLSLLLSSVDPFDAQGVHQEHPRKFPMPGSCSQTEELPEHNTVARAFITSGPMHSLLSRIVADGLVESGCTSIQLKIKMLPSRLRDFVKKASVGYGDADGLLALIEKEKISMNRHMKNIELLISTSGVVNHHSMLKAMQTYRLLEIKNLVWELEWLMEEAFQSTPCKCAQNKGNTKKGKGSAGCKQSEIEEKILFKKAQNAHLFKYLAANGVNQISSLSKHVRNIMHVYIEEELNSDQELGKSAQRLEREVNTDAATLLHLISKLSPETATLEQLAAIKNVLVDSAQKYYSMTGTVNGLFNREKAFLENLLAKHKKGTTNSVKQALKSEYEKAAKAVLNKGLRALSIEVQFMQNVKKGIMWFIDLLESGGIKRYKSLEGAQSKCLFTNYLNNEIANQARKYNTSELDTSTGKPTGTILDSSSKGSSTINRGTDSESAQNKPQPYVYNESHNLLRDFDNNIIGAINRMPAEKKAETIEWLKRGLAASELQISLNSTAGPESLLHPESSLLFQPSAQKRVSEKIKEAVEEIKKTSEKNSAMEKRITELEKEAAAQDAALFKISKDTADLTNSTSEMENTASALDKDIAAFDKTVQSLKKQIEQQKEQEKARKGAIGDLKKKNEQEWSSINTLLGTGEITARGKNKKGTKKTELVSADIKKSTQEIKQLLKGMEDKAAALKKQRNTSEKRTDEALSKIKNYPKLEGAIKKMCRVEISMDAASKKGKKSPGKSSSKQPLAHTVTTAICDAAKKTNSPHEKALCSLSVKDICAEDSKEKSELQKSLEKCEKQPSLKSDIQKQENTVQQQIKDIQGLSDSIKFTAQLLNDTEKAILLARESKERERASFSETVAHLEEALKQPLQAVINTLQDAKQHMPLAEDVPFVLSETDSGGIDSSIRSLDKAINSLRLLNTYMYQRSDKLMDESQECQMSLSEATEEPTTEEQERIRPTEITSTLKTENVSILETTSEETLAPTVASNNSISKSSLPSIPEEPTTTEEVISTAETIIPTVPAIDESITITEKAVDETPATEKSFVGTETFIPTLSTIDESINTAEESLPEEYTGAEENLSTTPTETNPAILETSCNTTDEIPSTEYFDINDLDDIFKITMSGELTPEEKIKPLFTCEETETDPLTSPEISSSPSVPTTSEIPTTVKIPTTPKVSSSSSIPTTSETPTTPKVSSSPSVLTTSEIPTTSETPTTPKVSSSPSVPTTSEIPTTVETPAISASPVLPTVPLAVGTILPSAIEKNKTTENKTKRPRTKIKLGPRLHKNNTYVNRPLQIENIL